MTLPSVQVLLIEDDLTDRLLVRELVALRGRGRFHLTEAADLPAGLDLLGARAFDLILLDTHLHDVSSLSALRAVGDRVPHTPILPHPEFITMEMRLAARQRGAWDLVVRGWLDPMWEAVGDLLELRTQDPPGTAQRAKMA